MNTLGPPVQIAYAVRDVDAAAEQWAARTGAGPFVISRHIALATARVHGEPDTFDHSSAYGQWGEVMVELVEEHAIPTGRGPLVEPGSGVHHMAFFVDDVAGAVRWCGSQGWPEVLWAETAGGTAFAFCDARRDLGHLVELYEPTPPLLAFYTHIRNLSAIRP